jgi:hypothetical protein
MATPWPDKPCPYCRQPIVDLIMEMVPDADQSTPDYAAINDRRPGGAVTCAYCQEPVEYDSNGQDLVQSTRKPLRYSRSKTEERAKFYGEAFLDNPQTSPEEWIAHDKAMPGALAGYQYAEDS